MFEEEYQLVVQEVNCWAVDRPRGRREETTRGGSRGGPLMALAPAPLKVKGPVASCKWCSYVNYVIIMSSMFYLSYYHSNY